jgi:hypothetical protein
MFKYIIRNVKLRQTGYIDYNEKFLKSLNFWIIK